MGTTGSKAMEGAEARGWQAASYVRLSHEDGIGNESNSIASQRIIIEEWAARRDDVVIVAHYVDDGYSGANFDRPGFRKMIEDAKSGAFNTIVVKDLSRFGRSYLDCGSWIERDLPRLGVRLYSITDDFDSMSIWDYNMALLLPVKNLMNEMQVMMTSEKVRTSLAARRERGECVANFAPYGYTKDPADRHKLIVDDAAAEIVRRIFDLALSGKSATAIAKILNEGEVPSPAAHKALQGLAYQTNFCSSEAAPQWHARTVTRILCDETYTGTLVQGKTRRPSWRLRKGISVPPSEWMRTYKAHEAIVDDETFVSAGNLFRQATSPPIENGDSIYVPFIVHVECGGCGSKMKRSSVKSGENRYVYYVCSAHRKNSRVCSTHSIREDLLLSQVYELTQAYQAGSKTRVRVVVHSKDRVEITGEPDDATSLLR